MLDHVQNYLKWMKNNMTQNEICPGITEVTTPFLDRHNDYTQIYIKKDEDDFIVTDGGFTLTDLAMCGMEFNTDRKKEVLNQTLNRLGISLNEKNMELFINSTETGLPAAEHQMIQSMLDISDMFYLASPSIRNLFFDEVKGFFDTNEIYYSEDIGVIGKSGFNHTFNFLLQRNKKHPQRFIKLMNVASRNNMERYIFSWNDIKENRKTDKRESRLIVLINDDKKVSNTVLDGFRKYDIEPVLWSERSDNTEEFA